MGRRLVSRRAPDIKLTSYTLPEWGVHIPLSPDGQEVVKGRGACGRILKGHSSQLGTVAVKVLTLPDAEARLATVQAYSQLQASVEGPGLVKFHAALQQGSNLLIFTQYMPGKDLRSNLTHDKKQRLHWGALGGHIALDVCRALARLHAHDVKHWHLKSSNVLFARPGSSRVALADTGLAALLGADSRDQSSSGSFAWAAPELLLSEKCTVQADIFSYGVLLWELVTQEVPLRGKLRDPIVPNECPAEVVQLISDCLSHDPSARPTAEQVCQRLVQMLPQAGADASQAGSPFSIAAPAQLAGPRTTSTGALSMQSSDSLSASALPDSPGGQTADAMHDFAEGSSSSARTSQDSNASQRPREEPIKYDPNLQALPGLGRALSTPDPTHSLHLPGQGSPPPNPFEGLCLPL